jgi:hypothetical protein
VSRFIDVIGGAGGLEVEYDDLGMAAHVLQNAALDVADAALGARRVLTDPGLLASSVLDPGGFARVEAAVLAAIVGPHGLVAASARIEERSLVLRAAVLRYVAADRLDSAWRETRHWAEGTAAAFLLPVTAVAAVSSIAALKLAGRDPGAVLAEHPGLAEEVSGSAPAFLDALLLRAVGAPVAAAELAAWLTGGAGPSSYLEQAAGLVGSTYPPGSAVVVGRGTDSSAPPAPRGVGDLLAALEHRDSLASGDAQGEIDVRRLTRVGPAGGRTTSWVVDLPGTKDWDLDPRHREHLNDLTTNLTTMAGDHSPRIDGVTRALELAGVGPDEPVMLVGHSQGGLVALRAAEQYAHDGAFNITHVVTAGSPIARMSVPESVSVLAFENRYDIVPQLDGQPSPDQRNRITVLIDRQQHDLGLNHAIATTYLPGARALEGMMNDPSLAGWRDGAGAFLAPSDEPVSVRTTVWDIRNGG